MATDNGLLFPPGTAWSYSNTNYVVLGLLIVRVTGTSGARPLARRLIRRAAQDVRTAAASLNDIATDG